MHTLLIDFSHDFLEDLLYFRENSYNFLNMLEVKDPGI